MTTHPNIGTGLFACAIFAAFFAAQHLDMTDHSAEHAQADELQAALRRGKAAPQGRGSAVRMRAEQRL